MLQPVVLDLNEVIFDTIKMLGRVIGENIELVAMLNPKTGRINVDPGQLSQIIMNLAINARDAMPNGGKLTIETANVFLDHTYTSRYEGVLPGSYVMFSVSDNGIGMNDETQKHLFEPFYTTKEIGKGTGLGLSTVYGIVKQSGGNIEFYSEKNIGTAFKIYLPRVISGTEKTEMAENSNEMPKGTETILLVEDEDLVRNLTLEVLKSCGYRVIEARNGSEALEICEKIECNIDLLLTDVVMPLMSGRELAGSITQIYTSVRILFTSGYTDDEVIRHGVTGLGANFIQKPFSPVALAQKVREILDSSS
jgi:CheY-like chemotaxis protein